jgi:hypothetical protein
MVALGLSGSAVAKRWNLRGVRKGSRLANMACNTSTGRILRASIIAERAGAAASSSRLALLF